MRNEAATLPEQRKFEARQLFSSEHTCILGCCARISAPQSPKRTAHGLGALRCCWLQRRPRGCWALRRPRGHSRAGQTPAHSPAALPEHKRGGRERKSLASKGSSTGSGDRRAPRGAPLRRGAAALRPAGGRPLQAERRALRRLCSSKACAPCAAAARRPLRCARSARTQDGRRT
jgi:hypothetical protein